MVNGNVLFCTASHFQITYTDWLKHAMYFKNETQNKNYGVTLKRPFANAVQYYILGLQIVSF